MKLGAISLGWDHDEDQQRSTAASGVLMLAAEDSPVQADQAGSSCRNLPSALLDGWPAAGWYARA